MLNQKKEKGKKCLISDLFYLNLINPYFTVLIHFQPLSHPLRKQYILHDINFNLDESIKVF